MADDAALAERPESKPKGGKGAVMTARITQEMRDALEAEAGRTGRTLAQVAELWMEQARAGRVELDAALDVPTVGPVLRQLVRYSEMVKAEVGDPGQDPHAREALLHGWRYLIARMPHPGPSAEWLAKVQRHREVRAAAGKALAALRAIPDHNPDSALLKACLATPSLNIFAKNYEPGERASFLELLMMLAPTDDDDTLDPAQLAASVRTADRLFAKLEGLLDSVGDEDPDVPFMDALGELIRASTREVEANAELQRRKHETVDRANGLLLKLGAVDEPADAR